MRIDILTLFPDWVKQMTGESILGRAQGKGLVDIAVHNLRDWAKDSYGSVDDHPYGGGPGMVLRVDVVAPAIQEIRQQNPEAKVILLTPQGEVYKQRMATTFTHESGIILVCGHYEGYDERIREYVDEEISIGDYVLTGGELAAAVIVDSVVRLLPGVLGDDASSVDESHSAGLLEYPHFTRPPEYDGKKVPEILLGGNHKAIEEWRREQARYKTKLRRPDMLNQ